MVGAAWLLPPLDTILKREEVEGAACLILVFIVWICLLLGVYYEREILACNLIIYINDKTS